MITEKFDEKKCLMFKYHILWNKLLTCTVGLLESSSKGIIELESGTSNNSLTFI